VNVTQPAESLLCGKRRRLIWIGFYIVQGKNGNFRDVVPGYDTLDGYLTNSLYFGALIGRYGNRTFMTDIPG